MNTGWSPGSSTASAELVPIHHPTGLGADRQNPQARLHRPQRGRRDGAVPGTPGVLDPTGRRWTTRWKAPLDAFQIAFDGRLTPERQLTTQQPRPAVKSTRPRWKEATDGDEESALAGPWPGNAPELLAEAGVQVGDIGSKGAFRLHVWMRAEKGA